MNQLPSHCSLQPSWLRWSDLTLVCPNTLGSKPSREDGPDSIGEKQHQLCVIPLRDICPQQCQWTRQTSKAKCCLGKSVLFPTAMCWCRLTICQPRKQLRVLRFVVSGSSMSRRSFWYPADCCHSFTDAAVCAGLWSRLGLDLPWCFLGRGGTVPYFQNWFSFFTWFVAWPQILLWQLETAGCSLQVRTKVLSVFVERWMTPVSGEALLKLV